MSEDRGLKPLLRLIEDQINIKVIADFARTKAKQLYAKGEIDMLVMRQAVALTHVNPRDHTDVFIRLHAANVLNLSFKFRMKSAKNSRDQAEFNRTALAGFPWRTINETRADNGSDPVEGGDIVVVMTPIGTMPLEMIGGNMVPNTNDQKHYLDSLFQQSPLVLPSGVSVVGTPITGTPTAEQPETIVVTQEVEVDDEGEAIDE